MFSNEDAKIVEKSDLIKNEITEIDRKRLWGANYYIPFEEVDRKQEEKDVIAYQKTGDEEILARLYRNRIPTFQILAKKNQYINNDYEDLFGELVFHFMKALKQYDPNKASFNTFLYTSLLNCIKNIISYRLAKKRRPAGSDSKQVKNYTLSLDYQYNNDENEENNTLKNTIIHEMADDSIYSSLHLSDFKNFIAKQYPELMPVMEKLSRGDNLANICRTMKTRKGKINIHNLEKKPQKRTAIKMLSEKFENQSFNLKHIDVAENSIEYVIELDKTKETDRIMKSIRQLRKKKDSMLKKINNA